MNTARIPGPELNPHYRSRAQATGSLRLHYAFDNLLDSCPSSQIIDKSRFFLKIPTCETTVNFQTTESATERPGKFRQLYQTENLLA